MQSINAMEINLIMMSLTVQGAANPFKHCFIKPANNKKWSNCYMIVAVNFIFLSYLNIYLELQSHVGWQGPSQVT